MLQNLDAAFLADIVEHPEDDAPRLIYADWLDDQGDSDRAEFIRLQIERAKLPRRDPREMILSRRESALRHAGESAWMAQLPLLTGVTWEGFSRGFVEAAFVETVDIFLHQVDVLFAVAPIRRIQFGRLDAGDARRLARCSALTRLSELNIGNNPHLGINGLTALIQSNHLCNLTALLLHNNELGDEAMSVLAESPNLGWLCELYLSGNDLGDEGVIALAQSNAMPNLSELDLRDNRITNIGVGNLAGHGWHDRLRTLYLVNNQVGSAGARALAASVFLPRLTHLYLNYNPIGNDGARAFAEWPHLHGLRDLDMRQCAIRDTGGAALARAAHLEKLELLWLGGNRFHSETLTLLRGRFGARLRM